MKTLLIAIVFLWANTSFSQDNLDSIINSLNNKDVYVAPVIRGVYIASPGSKINRDSAKLNLSFFTVSSLDESIDRLAGKFTSQILAQRLYSLLRDSTRDFYANVLLYELFDNRFLGNFFGMNRKQWIESGRRSRDEQKWDQYMERLLIVRR